MTYFYFVFKLLHINVSQRKTNKKTTPPKNKNAMSHLNTLGLFRIRLLKPSSTSHLDFMIFCPVSGPQCRNVDLRCCRAIPPPCGQHGNCPGNTQVPPAVHKWNQLSNTNQALPVIMLPTSFLFREELFLWATPSSTQKHSPPGIFGWSQPLTTNLYL